MAHKKNFQGKETFHRVNFLYQAADLCRQLPGSQGKKLMMIYGSQLTSVCRKTLSRVDVGMKRSICKGCNAILVPGDTAMVRMSKKPESQIVWICTMCGAYRLFNTTPGHKMWRDSPDSVVETIDLNKTEEAPPTTGNKMQRSEVHKTSEPSAKKMKNSNLSKDGGETTSTSCVTTNTIVPVSSGCSST
uniref:Ribonuclease P protein subunit p21 n=1 Tax=Lygus hesperus TaxID=30085 RepID=A0A146ME58_LYGHE